MIETALFSKHKGTTNNQINETVSALCKPLSHQSQSMQYSFLKCQSIVCKENLYTASADVAACWVMTQHNLSLKFLCTKKNFCIIKIWLTDYSLQDGAAIITIANLEKQGVAFKKHAPEF